MIKFILRGQSVFCFFMVLLVSTMLFSCGGGESDSQANSTGIDYQLKWPSAKSVASELPAGVVTVRISVSGSDMSTISKDFQASARTGSVDGVPVGNNRTIIFQGLNVGGQIIYEAVKYSVTLSSGVKYDCGTVNMLNSVPVAPSNLLAVAASSSQVNLTWTDSASNETGYRIERSSDSGASYESIATIAHSNSSYSDKTVAAATAYYYRVVAINGIGSSGYGNEVNVITPAITYSISGTITSGGSGVAGVTVSVAGSSATTASGGSYSIAGLQNGIYTVTPVLAGYEFTPVNREVTVNSSSITADFAATANTLPAAPSGLSAEAVATTAINLVWVDNANNETGYEIWRKGPADGDYVLIHTTNASIVSYADSSLSVDTNYYYKVRAMNTVGDSEYSSEVTIKTRSESMAISPVMISVSGGLNGSSVGSFRIGAYEVTQREWLSVMGYNPSGFSSCGLECPVENVSYDDVLSFISTLNGISDTKYRLPTSSEWKYAGQSGGAGELYSGGSDVDAVAWYSGNSGSTTHQVGQKQANGLGIYDMSGNVWEWSSDSKVWGGSWRDSAAGVEIDKLTSSIPATTRTNYLGFRLAVK